MFITKHSITGLLMIKVSCPACNTPLEIGPGAEIGQHVICPGCQKDLVIIWLYPLELEVGMDPPDSINRKHKWSSPPPDQLS
jgi:hypothetical protein